MTGVAVYDSVPYPEEGGSTTVLDWVPIGGTSVASPIIASMFALAGGAHTVEYPAETLYSHIASPLLHDITEGGNGKCDGVYSTCSGSMSPLSALDCGKRALICNAAPGYDGPTGVGTQTGSRPSSPAAKASSRPKKSDARKKSFVKKNSAPNRNAKNGSARKGKRKKKRTSRVATHR